MKSKILKIVLVLILAIWLTSCDENNKKEWNNISTKENTKNIINLEYKIEKKDFIKWIKASFDIRLNEKITEKEIKEIAEKIKNKNSWYERYFISYFLWNMKTNEWAWATSHFNPNLKISILWLTKIEENNNEENFPKWKIIWKWIDESILWSINIIFIDNEEYKIRKLYKDWSFWDTELKKEWNIYKYENDFWEYYKIENNWKLWIYTENGLFSTINKLK